MAERSVKDLHAAFAQADKKTTTTKALGGN